MRQATIARKTKETDIHLTIGLDGTGKANIKTDVAFFDHMLEQLAKHGLFDLNISCKGDLEIDSHHTVEDVGITLGQAIKEALGDKMGIRRYGHAYVPMDEALSRVALDLSNRPYLIWKVQFTIDRLGEQMETELFFEFFQAAMKRANPRRDRRFHRRGLELEERVSGDGIDALTAVDLHHDHAVRKLLQEIQHLQHGAFAEVRSR